MRLKFWSRRKIGGVCIKFLTVILCGLLVIPLGCRPARAAGFNPGNIMSDTVMANYATMNVAQIDNFLRLKCSYGNNCLYAKYFSGRSAAQVIWQAAQDYRINPQVLLVLLQKEQSLLTSTATEARLRKATGYGCPDTAACDSRYYGFENQIRRAAELFRTVLDGGWSNYPAYTTRYIQYHPNTACGGTNVYIENRATSALYRYTPYQPNAAALAGSGDGCSSYGNRNFYNLFTSWFGDTGGTLAASATNALNSTYYLPNDVFALQIGNDMALEFLGSETGASAQIREYHGGASQLFTLEREGRYYQIRHVYSNKYLDVSNAETADGTKIQLYEQNETCAQQWAIEWDGQKFELKNACSGKNLDVKDGYIDQTDNNVHLWVDNDTTAQKWTLRDVLAAPLTDGDYNLATSHEKIVIGLPSDNFTEGSDLQTSIVTTNTNQIFEARRTSEGLYEFINRRTGMYLDVDNAGSADGTAVQLWTGNGTCAQKWIVEKYGSGYHIRSSCSGKSLDVSDARVNEAGIKVQIWNNNNTIAQLWYFKDPREVE